MEYTTFNEGNIKTLRADLEAGIKALGQELGVDIQIGRISYNGNQVKTKMEVSIIGETGKVFDVTVQDFKTYSKFHPGLEGQLGKSFTFQGKTFKISGWKKASRKYPILAKLPNGKTYKFDVENVLRALK